MNFYYNFMTNKATCWTRMECRCVREGRSQYVVAVSWSCVNGRLNVSGMISTWCPQEGINIQKHHDLLFFSFFFFWDNENWLIGQMPWWHLVHFKKLYCAFAVPGSREALWNSSNTCFFIELLSNILLILLVLCLMETEISFTIFFGLLDLVMCDWRY